MTPHAPALPDCARLQTDAAGLASLAPDDPQRRAAEAHAAACPACAAALAEGHALMRLLDEALPLAAPAPEAIAPAQSAIVTQIGSALGAELRRPPRRSSPMPAPRSLGIFFAALSTEWLLPMVKRLGAGPGPIASGGIAIMAASVAMGAVLAGPRALALLPAASVGVTIFNGGDAGLQAKMGLACAAMELALSLVPVGAMAYLARWGRVSPPLLALGAGAGGGALIGQAVLHVACHADKSTVHNLVFHTLPVLLGVGLAALASRKRSFAARAP
jgi:hypothetical protein